MKLLLHALIALNLAGCGSLGLQEPQSLEDRIAYASGTNTGLREASTDALNHGSISSADMEHIIALNDRIAEGLKGARMLAGTDPTTAEGRLAAALTLLRELQSYTRSRGIKTSDNDWSNAPWMTQTRAWTSPSPS